MKSKNVLFYAILISALMAMFIIFHASGNAFAKDKNAERQSLRLICIYLGNSDYYRDQLHDGLIKAAIEQDVWIKFVSIKPYESDKHYEELDKAIAAKVDGIITNVPDGKMVKKYIDSACANGIPVVTIESDSPESKRISFVGTNSYAYGIRAAKLMISASGENARTAIFKNSDNNKLNLKNQGFQNTIKDQSDMNTELFTVQESSAIEYANAAHSIFIDNPAIDSFFCPDAESTLGVVRAMIEFNKIKGAVIGSGDSLEVLKYIKNGLVYATLVEDPYSIGYLSVSNLCKYRNGESISEFINTDVIAISRDNVDKILAHRKDTR